MPKYSLLLPSRNGGKYLPTCIQTIIDQGFHDFEVILSDDHSTDETLNFLDSLRNPAVTILTPTIGLSMAEHWEWVLSKASGQWLIFVGQDDGLQPYFFQLCEKLTVVADQQGIRAIMSKRAYYYWPGCEAVYGDSVVSYRAKPVILSKNFDVEVRLSLFGFKPYFELPEMYTTSLFRRDLILEAKDRQNGKVFTTHPQDANLAAIAYSFEKKYLHSEIPLGWVGSSPKSAGMAVNYNQNSHPDQNIEKLRSEYLQKTNSSVLKLHPFIGDFAFGSAALYLWGALLQTQNLRSEKKNKFFLAKTTKYLMFSGILAEMCRVKDRIPDDRLQMFRTIVKKNGCRFITIQIIVVLYRIIYRLYVVAGILKEKLWRNIVSFDIKRSDNTDITMLDASIMVSRQVESTRLIKRL